MARPLRIEFPGAIYHVTSRGDRREAIFVDDVDREALIDVVATGMSRFDAQVLAYCLMGNHYHFVLHTRKANLSLLMRHLNGVYTQAFNRRHNKVGHLLQGRFSAILVDRDAYLLEVCRYVELNPVRARMVDEPAQWPWSSYRGHVGQASTPQWLDDTVGLHGHLLGSRYRVPGIRYPVSGIRYPVSGIHTRHTAAQVGRVGWLRRFAGSIRACHKCTRPDHRVHANTLACHKTSCARLQARRRGRPARWRSIRRQCALARDTASTRAGKGHSVNARWRGTRRESPMARHTARKRAGQGHDVETPGLSNHQGAKAAQPPRCSLSPPSPSA